MALISLLLLALKSIALCLADLREIKVLTLLPYPQPQLPPILRPSISDGASLYPASLLASEIANNRTDTLEGYVIRLSRADSGCSVPFRAVDAFVSSLLQQEKDKSVIPVVGAVGPGCSTSSRSVAALSGRSEIALINVHLSGTQELNNRILYPYSFGILDSAEAIAKAMVSLIRVKNWTHIVLFYDDSRLYYSSLTKAVQNEASLYNISMNQLAISAHNLSPFKNNVRNRYRIIFLLLGTDLLNMVLCIAHNEKYVLPVYQYILDADEVETITSVTFADYTCTEDQLRDLIEESIIIEYQLERHDWNTTTDSGISLLEFYHLYQSYGYLHEIDGTDAVNIYAAAFFDATWSLLKALDNSKNSVNLSAYGYAQPIASEMIRNELLKLDFEGLSGRIKFDNTSGRIQQNVHILKIKNRERQIIATFNRIENKIIKSDKLFQLLINDKFDITIKAIPRPVSYITLLITGLVFLLILTLNILTCYYRDVKFVKASSVKLNLLAFISCYIFTAALVLTTIIYSFSDLIIDSQICKIYNILEFLISFGLTLLFGTICVRTWRMYRIFVHYKNPGPLLSDNHLALAVLITILVDFSIVIPGLITNPYKHSYLEDMRIDIPNSPTKIMILKCVRRNFLAWFFAGLIVSILLLTLILILAFLTRKIRQKVFQTKCIMNQSYILTGVLPILIGFYLIFYSQKTFISVIVSFCTLIIFELSLILIPCAMLFLPPLLPILRHAMRFHYH